MNTFTAIIIASLSSTGLGLFVASWLSLQLMARIIRLMVGFSIGVLLGIALLHSMPEAFSLLPQSTNLLFALFLVGLLSFFTLEKCALLRHDHHHEGDGHEHHHGHDRQTTGRTGVTIFVGDGLHNLIDGVLITTAFIADTRLGLVTTMAVIAHEVPQKVGNFIVLLNASFSRLRAYFYMMFSGLMAFLGALLGYWFLQSMTQALPYMLVISSSSFVYIAVSDLMPQTHKRKQSIREIFAQIGLVLLGLLVVIAATSIEK